MVDSRALNGEMTPRTAPGHSKKSPVDLRYEVPDRFGDRSIFLKNVGYQNVLTKKGKLISVLFFLLVDSRAPERLKGLPEPPQGTQKTPLDPAMWLKAYWLKFRPKILC